MDNTLAQLSTLSGTILDKRFKLEEKIGAGGMSTVYRAIDNETGETVALKVLHSHPERFEREAAVLAGLDHPNIVRYVAHGSTVGGGRYLAMEWLNGEELEEALQRCGNLSVDDSLTVVRQVAEALATAHDSGVTHRDIKPSNIMLIGGAMDKVKLIDFGVAKLSAAENRVTRTGIQIGTPGYMAPEQVRGKKDIDSRADVFAMGCLLYECLTGELAFEADHAIAVLSKILFEEAPRASALHPEIPPALDRLIALMLEKEPQARPANGRALLEELDSLDLLDAAAATQKIELRDVLALMEQGAVSLVVAGTREHEHAPADLHNDVTLVNEPLEIPIDQINNRLDEHDVQLETLADGSVVAIFTGNPDSAQQAANAATCALMMREVVPTIPIAVASGLRNAEFVLPVGEVIDRAVSALDGTPDGHIWLDEKTVELLPPDFTTETVDSIHYLAGRAEIENS